MMAYHKITCSLFCCRVVCILSGGNIDTTILGRCLERGLAAEQRLVKFKVTVSDRPGGIAELCKLISSTGVSIKDIMQERAWVHGDIFSVRVKIEFFVAFPTFCYYLLICSVFQPAEIKRPFIKKKEKKNIFAIFGVLDFSNR